MNNKEKGIKIQNSRPFQTILDVGLQRLLSLDPTGGAYSVPQDPPAECLRSLCS